MKKPMRIFAVIIVLILIGIALYWVGLSQGRSQLETERKTFTSQLEQANSKLVSSEYNTRLNLARFLLCKTVMDLDQRNFGLAHNRLNEAYAALGNINPAMIGVDQGRFDALRKEMAATEINVTANVDEQRGKVFSFSEQLESLLPRTPQTSVALPPAPRPASAPAQTQAPAAPAPGPSPAPVQTTAPQPPATPAK
jgi:hypothetical protein